MRGGLVLLPVLGHAATLTNISNKRCTLSGLFCK